MRMTQPPTIHAGCRPCGPNKNTRKATESQLLSGCYRASFSRFWSRAPRVDSLYWAPDLRLIARLSSRPSSSIVNVPSASESR